MCSRVAVKRMRDLSSECRKWIESCMDSQRRSAAAVLPCPMNGTIGNTRSCRRRCRSCCSCCCTWLPRSVEKQSPHIGGKGVSPLGAEAINPLMSGESSIGTRAKVMFLHFSETNSNCSRAESNSSRSMAMPGMVRRASSITKSRGYVASRTATSSSPPSNFRMREVDPVAAAQSTTPNAADAMRRTQGKLSARDGVNHQCEFALISMCVATTTSTLV